MTVLPLKCRRYLTERGIVFEEVEDGGQKAVILRRVSLPAIGAIGRPDIVARVVTRHPTPQQITPGTLSVVVNDGREKWACLRCPCGCGAVAKEVPENLENTKPRDLPRLKVPEFSGFTRYRREGFVGRFSHFSIVSQ